MADNGDQRLSLVVLPSTSSAISPSSLCNAGLLAPSGIPQLLPPGG